MPPTLVLGKNRLRSFVRGLGNMQVREREPANDPNFSNVGYLKNTTTTDEPTMVDIMPETGHMIDYKMQSRKTGGNTNLQQTGIDELNLIRQAEGKIYAVRYHGVQDEQGTAFLYYCFETVRLNPTISQNYQPGERLLPLAWVGLKDESLQYDLPEYYLIGTNGEIEIEKLQLWLDSRQELNLATARVLDVSGFSRHGLISSDFATIWTLGGEIRFLRLDGVNDAVDHGNILSMNGTDDFAFEAWVRPQGADGVEQEIMGKKADYATNSAGWGITRHVVNGIGFKISDGAVSAQILSANGTVLQNVWKFLRVSIDRNGNGQIYLNGIASGAPVSVAGIGGGSSSSDTLYIGRIGSLFGQVDIASVRVYNYGSGGLPANDAAIALRHFNAEKSFFGL